jgi:thioredoxin-like negative regulator of GroEL
VDASPQTASQHGIRGVPAIYFYDRGNIFDKAIGALPKGEIERRVQALISRPGTV